MGRGDPDNKEKPVMGDLVEQHPKQVAASAKVPQWKCTSNDKTKACESGGV